MAKTTKTDASTTPLPQPPHGGAWLRLADGSLIPDPAVHPTVAPPVETALKEV